MNNPLRLARRRFLQGTAAAAISSPLFCRAAEGAGDPLDGPTLQDAEDRNDQGRRYPN